MMLMTLQPKWYTLKSRRKEAKKKSSLVSGDIQLQFSLVDTASPEASVQDIIQKLHSVIALSPEEDKQDDADLALLEKSTTLDDTAGEDDDEDEDEELSDEMEDPTKPETPEKRRRRLRLKRLKRKTKARAYEFTGGSDVVGIIFLEIGRVTDLPPERNGMSSTTYHARKLMNIVTRTGFDMDPFVIASLGRRTYRTRVIRHNLNPVFDEKLIFQVMRHEQQYSMHFSVVDRDKLSGNDFIAKADFEISNLIDDAPEADPETGLYKLREVSEPSTPIPSKSRFRLPLSRTTSSQSLKGLGRPPLNRGSSQVSLNSGNGGSQDSGPAPTSVPDPNALAPYPSNSQSEQGSDEKSSSAPHDDATDLRTYVIPLELKNKEKWNERHPTQLFIRAKYMPYPALRQQFWRSMLKQYDADESRKISKLELTTMLDTLGSTLKESTIDAFFTRFGQTDPSTGELTFDEVTICLEDQLQRSQARHGTESVLGRLSRAITAESATQTTNTSRSSTRVVPVSDVPSATTADKPVPANEDPTSPTVPAIESEHKGVRGEQGKQLDEDDLVDDRGVEHVIEIRECPICHQPRLNKRSDADIITHIATCASQDWRQVNNLVMAGFVTASQAQRKWYSKVVTKISYGGYKLGANSANILVQDRITGQINEERMSVYVRLGIRLLYKGLGSRDMEKKRSKRLSLA
jgi:phosphatidylserine decarboxylase